MSRRLLVIHLILAFLCLAPVCIGQGQAHLKGKMESVKRAVGNTEAGSKLEREIPNDKDGFQRFKLKDGDFYVAYNEYPSLEEAVRIMRLQADGVAGGQPRPLEGFGDEANIWESLDGTGRATVQLRYGNTLVSIHASSPQIVRRAARLVANEFASK